MILPISQQNEAPQGEEVLPRPSSSKRQEGGPEPRADFLQMWEGSITTMLAWWFTASA